MEKVKDLKEIYFEIRENERNKLLYEGRPEDANYCVVKQDMSASPNTFAIFDGTSFINIKNKFPSKGMIYSNLSAANSVAKEQQDKFINVKIYADPIKNWTIEG